MNLKNVKSVVAVLLILAMVLSLSACGGGDQNKSTTADQGDMREITDAAGRKVNIPKEVDSLVCLGVGALRLTIYNNGIHKVVGVEDVEKGVPVIKAAIYAYQDKINTLPSIGTAAEPNTEALIQLAPDVIISSNEKGNADAITEKTGIPVVVIPITDQVFDEEVYKALSLIGEVLNDQEKSDDMIAYIKSIESDLTKRVASIPEEEKPSVYLGAVNFKGAHGIEGTEAGYPPFAVLGLKNVADEIEQKGAFDVDVEKIHQWDPDIIFLDQGNIDLVQEDYNKRPEFYEQLRAVQEDKVFSQIGYRHSGTNTEMALINAYYVGKAVFPEAFSDVDMDAKIDEITEVMLKYPMKQSLEEAGYVFGPLSLKNE
ncbi:MAG: iron ABC transporter substrate-binding protein [Eubacteriaceae bacterium]|nr:iron ABC transporter substrate-binding protein [Eubacteriaceae bacterium]